MTVKLVVMLLLLLVELAPPVLFGLLLQIATPEILKWKIAAWRWLAVSVAAFSLAILSSWLQQDSASGIAFAIGTFSVIRGLVSSATAWELYRQDCALQMAQRQQLEISESGAINEEQ